MQASSKHVRNEKPRILSHPKPLPNEMINPRSCNPHNSKLIDSRHCNPATTTFNFLIKYPKTRYVCALKILSKTTLSSTPKPAHRCGSSQTEAQKSPGGCSKMINGPATTESSVGAPSVSAITAIIIPLFSNSIGTTEEFVCGSNSTLIFTSPWKNTA